MADLPRSGCIAISSMLTAGLLGEKKWENNNLVEVEERNTINIYCINPQHFASDYSTSARLVGEVAGILQVA